VVHIEEVKVLGGGRGERNLKKRKERGEDGKRRERKNWWRERKMRQ
jgi:hypothetical protein